MCQERGHQRRSPQTDKRRGGPTARALASNSRNPDGSAAHSRNYAYVCEGIPSDAVNTVCPCPVDRNNPIRCESSESRVSLMEFSGVSRRRYVLEWLWREPGLRTARTRLPEVQDAAFVQALRDLQRRQSGPAPAAATVPPRRGRSSTSRPRRAPVVHAFYLRTSTRCVSPRSTWSASWRQLQNAWGAQQDSHELMDQTDNEPLSGEVEADETAWGGKQAPR